MSSALSTEAEAKDRLWDEVHKARYGMLGLVGAKSGGHFQPMTAFSEPETGDIWFFTLKTTDLAWAIGADGGEAMLVVQSKDQTFQACIGGRLAQQFDRVRMDKYWNAVVAAWYPEGKDDPNLTMLRLDARDAQVWLSESNPVKFAWEIAKANLTHNPPDLGESRPVDLSGGRA